MKKNILFLLVLVLSVFQSVNGAESTLKKANEMYGAGNYADAAALYEQILQQNEIAPELYYNLGNAYYKMNETGKSILNYERALRLNPRYENARINLEFAQAQVIDNVVPVPTFFLNRWFVSFVKILSSDQWFYLSVLALLVSLVFATFFVYASSHQFRRVSFYLSTIVGAFMLLSLFFSGMRKNQLVNHDHAVIMAGSVTAKSSPDKSGTDLFQLHEGTKVTVKSRLGDWTEIVLGNGAVGWVVADNMIEI